MNTAYKSTALAMTVLVIGSSAAMAQATPAPHNSHSGMSNSGMGASAPMSAPATLDRPYGSENAPPYRPPHDSQTNQGQTNQGQAYQGQTPGMMAPQGSQSAGSSGSTGYEQPSGTSQSMTAPPAVVPVNPGAVASDRNTLPYEWHSRAGSSGRNDIPGLPREQDPMGSGLYNGY